MEPSAFGKYQLHERLGEGGMAVVFRAKLHGPGGFEKVLCLKQIREELSARPEFVDLFVAEAKLTVSLTHANIVPVYELGMVDGTYFLALELIDGPPLAGLFASGPLPAPLAAYVVEQTLRGLDYAHRHGVVHRDLSSANVLVSRDGEVKIVDFGIAATAHATAVAGGSRGYVAPEQEAGGRADARSDLYAAGVLLWELCAGRRFDGTRGDAPEALQTIVERATASDPDARHPDAAAMLAAVARYLREVDGPTQAALSELVRRRCPDAPAAQGRHEEARDGGQRDDQGRTFDGHGHGDGPRTVPVVGRKREVTFATRVAVPARSSVGSVAVAALSLAAGMAGLGALAAFPTAGASGAVSRAPGVSTTNRPASGANRSATASSDGKPATAGKNPALGHLIVRSVPPGAEVRLGDRALGITPVEADVPLAGPALLRLRVRNFAPVERTLDAAQFTGAPRTATVNERLRPLGRGTLTLGALPWAHVTIDGEKRPDTPLVRLPLAAGPHQVHLVCPPTGRELKLTITVEADAELKRVVDLRGEPRIIE